MDRGDSVAEEADLAGLTISEEGGLAELEESCGQQPAVVRDEKRWPATRLTERVAPQATPASAGIQDRKSVQLSPCPSFIIDTTNRLANP